MEPAQTIIKKLGGPTAVAKITGVHRTRVSSWQRSRDTGGTDGRIPQTHIPTLLGYAAAQDIPLKLEEFFDMGPPRSRRSKAASSRPRSRAA